MKILLYNVGYLTGLDGSFVDYLTGSYRYFWRRGGHRKNTAEKVRNLICEHAPDICGLIEIETAHAKNVISEYLIDGMPHLQSAVKYGEESMFRKIGFLKRNGNAVMSRKNYAIKNHYLGNGNKRLVLEIEVNQEFSVFIVHLSIRRQMRERQIRELKTIIRGKKKVIVCGDFNIFGGTDELKPLLNKTNLRIINKKHQLTYPAAKPKKALDLFLCSHNLKVTDLQVLDSTFSDHLPVLLEIDKSCL